jgi:hypothetical protein
VHYVNGYGICSFSEKGTNRDTTDSPFSCRSGDLVDGDNHV